ncbi:hypothetical protein K440DRAFT_668543, partial [Wilcoxina mikolae CBS 423.85]
CLSKLPHHPRSIPLRWRRSSARARREDPPFWFLVGVDGSGTLVPSSRRGTKRPSRDLNCRGLLLDANLCRLPLLQRELRGRRWGRLHLNEPFRLGGRERLEELSRLRRGHVVGTVGGDDEHAGKVGGGRIGGSVAEDEGAVGVVDDVLVRHGGVAVCEDEDDGEDEDEDE